MARNGLQSSTDYPYRARAEVCDDKKDKFHAHIKGYGAMGKAVGRGPASDTEIMSALISRGPIGFVLEASGRDFAFYR